MVKLSDVAKAAGVGYGTASRAITGKGSIDAETRSKVLAAAERLGYRPDAAARALRERRTRTVGLVVPDIVNEFYTSSAEVLQNRLAANGYQLVVATTGNDPAQEAVALRTMLDRQVDGIVHVPVAAEASAGIGVPLVELNRSTGRTSVVSDDVSGIAALTDVVADEGYESIVAITGPRTLSTSRDRVAGFVAALEARGFVVDAPRGRRFEIHETTYTADGGADVMRKLASSPPEAIVALSSRIALGVLQVASDEGIDVPGGVALAAYGDPDWFRIWRPGITAFAPALAEMGSRAAELLLAELSTGEPQESVRVSGEVRVRGSHTRG
ncbi:LacI family DNA-binding transcriptional regulator [Microbacterium atlanticum]|uniref:LacI family DNA-binding transcriptional regulator n=1 Tax=Microbacterium atlanticum TaxID=2782168 RepID=UPI001E41F1DE|nr:LacI family DNA-binding transcriptional regulator [Microbacterium atlanticum]